MKLEKLDSKQVPQVIVLGVLGVAALGYGGWKLMSGTSSAPAQAATPVSETTTVVSEKPDPKKAQPAKQMAAVLPGMGTLNPQFNPDPFRSKAPNPENLRPTPAPTPPPAPPVERAPSWTNGAGGLPDLDPTPAPVTPAAPAGPQRPEVAVVGVMDAQGGKDLAILKLGAEQRLVGVGDMVANDYRVKSVGLDGVWLTHGRDRYFSGSDSYFVAVRMLGGSDTTTK